MMILLLDDAHQKAMLATSQGSAIVAAIEAAGIIIEGGNRGWQILGTPQQLEGAQGIIDTEALWLPQAKGLRLEALRDEYAQKYVAGFLYGGKLYQIDAQSRANVTAQGALAAQVLNGTPGALSWPQGFTWIAIDNTKVPLDAAGMFAFAQAVSQYVTALVMRNRSLKDEIEGALDVGTLEGVDLGYGWPGP